MKATLIFCYLLLVFFILGLWQDKAYAWSPLPDIKVNDSDGPVTMARQGNLKLSVSLDNSGSEGAADWGLPL